jgi:SAM-dependent methyltransferase
MVSGESHVPRVERAKDHYQRLDEPDSQTSPTFVRVALDAWISGADVRDPILDLGTGRGHNLPSIATAHRVFGVDVSVDALGGARRFAPVVACDIAMLPFRDATFGAVVCTEVLEHVDDPRPAIAEAARVLSEGGVAYITTPNYVNLAGVHKLVADRRSGKHDWNPWGAHQGGYEAMMTGWKLWSFAKPWFELERARGLDYGQALTGRFSLLDRAAWSRGGKVILRRLLPRLEGSGGALAWFGMHVELVLRKRLSVTQV